MQSGDGEGLSVPPRAPLPAPPSDTLDAPPPPSATLAAPRPAAPAVTFWQPPASEAPVLALPAAAAPALAPAWGTPISTRAALEDGCAAIAPSLLLEQAPAGGPENAAAGEGASAPHVAPSFSWAAGAAASTAASASGAAASAGVSKPRSGAVAPAAGGWPADLLADNQAKAEAARKAAQDELDERNKGAPG